MSGLVLRIRGLVQGVGFRPNVWRLARESNLSGDVLNDGEGVLVRVWGADAEVERFCRRIRDEAPPLARIDSLERAPIAGPPLDGFVIAESRHNVIATGIVPDAATCPACLAEIHDATQRRHRYAFTNCTHCGPRLTIIKGIPYDRPLTSMAAFDLCPQCEAEYRNPADRRFHAQPIACPTCGPRLWLESADGAPIACEDAIETTAALLRDGKIVAVKGLGGFHLACDAMNAAAVAALRRRKRRGDKPFAVMMPDVASASAFVAVYGEAARFLRGSAAPILLLPRRPAQPALPDSIAPGQANIGIMLPYSPLHHLLLAAFDGPLVMTSGNRRDEPQCIANDDARDHLAGLADAFLMHDREIVNRVDDSVLRIAAGKPRLMRRARGYAPAGLPLAPGFADVPPVLAMGADLKNTFCLMRAGAAILSQHVGDLGEPRTAADGRKALALYRELFDFKPQSVAVDLHPDYAASRLGETIAAEVGAKTVTVQHHHAHIASCMAEHGVGPGEGPVLGVALDGIGFGSNGEIWGGEFLLCTYRSFRRVGRFSPVALPGGNQAMREPWRNAFAHLRSFTDWQEQSARHADLPIMRLLAGKNPPMLARMIERNLKAPPASSAGRLFDAVAAVLDIVPERISFEGEAAQKLEALAAAAPADCGQYGVDVADGELAELSWAPLWHGILADLARGEDKHIIARRFHDTLAAGVATLAQDLAERWQSGTVALSGGVFHNRLLLEGVMERLSHEPLRVLAPEQVPAGDGGLSLGQAAVAATTI